jgi:hypothetical protein
MMDEILHGPARERFFFQAQVIVCNLQVFFIFTLYNTLKDNDQLKVQ